MKSKTIYTVPYYTNYIHLNMQEEESNKERRGEEGERERERERLDRFMNGK